MKNLFFFNSAWGTVFVLFTTITIFGFQCNGHFDDPMSKTKYLSKGGNAFDYYLGYAYFTSEDTKNYSEDSKYELDIADRTIARYVYLFLYTGLWFWGFFRILNAYEYKKFLNLSKEEALKTESPPSKPTLFDYCLAIITTLISLYGIYYSTVYIMKFWLM